MHAAIAFTNAAFPTFLLVSLCADWYFHDVSNTTTSAENSCSPASIALISPVIVVC
jgi:hypothetical protein